jgi:uracil-DNA glycosylase
MGCSQPKDGDLSSWADQGVFLINSVLTVENAKANSHQKKGWELFTDSVIQILSQEMNNLVFILWGLPSQKKSKLIDETKHLVLKAPHPSPLSAYRGFFGSKPFSQTNNYLLEHSKSAINWCFDDN